MKEVRTKLDIYVETDCRKDREENEKERVYDLICKILEEANLNYQIYEQEIQ